MRLDLAERLRCPRAHAPTPLVVVASSVVERDLRSGVAGCPLCQLEARVIEGAVRFAASGADANRAATAPEVAAHETAEPPPALDRLIALLGLAEPGGSVLLSGRYATVAESLALATEVAAVVMQSAADIDCNAQVAAVLGEEHAVPFSDATFRGAALDRVSPEFAADAVRSVAVGGRVVGSAAQPVPAGLKVLAHDDTEWVAARESITAPIELRRR